MPIAVRAVSPADYTAWLAEAKKKHASNDKAPPATVLAAVRQ